MRKLVVTILTSLDSYYEGPGKDVMALPFDPAFDEYNRDRLRAADTMILGRTTFLQMRGYWPPLADDAGTGPVEREVSRLLNAIDKVVISDRLEPAERAPWDKARIVKRADAHAQVAALKRQRGREIIVFGSHLVWNDLLAAGLVDELHVMIGPAVLGAGTPAFEGQARMPLRLLEARTLDGSSLVLLRYSVDANPAKRARRPAAPRRRSDPRRS